MKPGNHSSLSDTYIAYSGPQQDEGSPQKTQQGKGSHTLSRMRVNTSGLDLEHTLVEGFTAIAAMANRLNMDATIGDRAKDAYKKLIKSRRVRVKKSDVLYGACLYYVACHNKTYKEVAEVTTFGAAAITNIKRMVQHIKKVLGEVEPYPKQVLSEAEPRGEGFHAINTMAKNLILDDIIRDRACDVYKKMVEAGACRPRGEEQNALYAACLYVACLNHNMDEARTYKELAKVTTKNKIRNMIILINKVLGKEAINKLFRKEVEQEMDMRVVPANYIKRFCSKLDMGKRETCAAKKAAEKLEEKGLDVRHTPVSIAAAIIYMAGKRAKTGKTIRAVSQATEVSKITISKTHKDLIKHAEILFA